MSFSWFLIGRLEAIYGFFHVVEGISANSPVTFNSLVTSNH